ncbi:Nramp family divalent metal transporter [Hydrogenothermus marinus]|uniref:Mn2+/Fe2+ NRAMP family transporter n=1 Tax=Hydrogenothermus marinus TaxID=133270 RepID=A0A3M0BM11_9AQUI|nr:Nramp family divalent metal transporter [Hydrogenothermus marinus]RMA97319.1 Mn2+/Fe2+ NRAMP family transporter [Hydrogenothermus marinus]
MNYSSFKEKVKKDIEKNRERIKKLGPGIITGSAGDDPAGIVTYMVVGATTGLTQLWLMLLSTPMLIAVQSTITKIALVSGKSLPELTTAFYSKKLTIFMILILAVANILTIAADLEALASIFGIITNKKPIYFLIPITAIIAYLVIYHSYKVVKKVLIILSLSLSVYIINVFLAKPDISLILKNTFIPHINIDTAWIIAALGLLGTTISPYMLFWQASEEKEEKNTVVQAKIAQLDTVIGMIYSNILAYCIIISGAIVLYGTKENIQTMTQLAQVLEPVSNHYAFMLFSIGVIVAGFLAIPVLAGSTAYAIADAFRWRAGMENKVSDAKGFYLVFLGSLILGDIIDVSPISVVDALYYSQVLDGILMPFLLAIIFVLANNKTIMGDFKNGRFNNMFLIITFLITLFLTVYAIYQLLIQ